MLHWRQHHLERPKTKQSNVCGHLPSLLPDLVSYTRSTWDSLIRTWWHSEDQRIGHAVLLLAWHRSWHSGSHPAMSQMQCAKTQASWNPAPTIASAPVHGTSAASPYWPLLTPQYHHWRQEAHLVYDQRLHQIRGVDGYPLLGGWVIAKAIFDRWICQFGCPLEIITDQAKEICAKLGQELFDLLKWKSDMPQHATAILPFTV